MKSKSPARRWTDNEWELLTAQTTDYPPATCVAVGCFEPDGTRAVYIGAVVQKAKHDEEVEVWWMGPKDAKAPAAEYNLLEHKTKKGQRSSYIAIVDRNFLLGEVQGLTVDLTTGECKGDVGAARWSKLQSLLADCEMS